MRSHNSSSPLSIMMFGLIFAAVGILTAFIFSQLGDLRCTRLEPSEINCTRTVKLFGLWLLREEPLPPLQGAHLSESCDSDGCSHRVDLETAAGVVPLVNYYTGGIGAYNRLREKVDKINAFLANPNQAELTLSSSLADQLLSLLPAAFFVIGGFMVLAGLRKFLLNLDENR